ncbi:hypothetical protein TeGR_g9139 [Tetraparma gracilis]|uniref:Uncharacterized protein n=1 Tax=Tetraparma gracilis TaxID=2962635 RepID=A0ABQ6MA08_9STRA|nr:hypothetical protein TeGR_g9139 [Tetraparma gracilis]
MLLLLSLSRFPAIRGAYPAGKYVRALLSPGSRRLVFPPGCNDRYWAKPSVGGGEEEDAYESQHSPRPRRPRPPPFEMTKSCLLLFLLSSLLGYNLFSRLPLVPNLAGVACYGGGSLALMTSKSKLGDVARVAGMRLAALANTALALEQDACVVRKAATVGGVVAGRALVFDRRHRVRDGVGKLLDSGWRKVYFAFVRPAADFDEGDGVELGRLIYYQLSKLRKNSDELREELDTFIKRTTVLRECAYQHRFIDELLFHVIRNKVRVGAVQANFAVNTGLAFITSNETGRIGKSLAKVLMTNTTSGAATDEYISKYPALEELAAEYGWFKPMLRAIAEELMSGVLYGVKARAAVGAAVSTSDMVSDGVVLADYFRTGRTGFAHGLLAMIGVNMLLQLFVTWLQTRRLKKDRKKKFLLEAAATLTFTKPGLDAWRVASGAEQVQGSVFNPLAEMNISKAIEVATESIPGLVLQLVAALTGGVAGTSKSMLFSLAISAASTGLAGTSIWFDTDTDPGQRQRSRKWIHPLPFLPSVGFTIVFRSIVKVVADYTRSPLFAQPPFHGGAYWLGNLAFTQVTMMGAVHIYNEFYDESRGLGDKTKASVLWTCAAALTTTWALAFGYFATQIVVPKHRHVLYNTISGREWCCDRFLEGTTDEAKMLIFRTNRLLWEPEIGDQVKAWTLANWARFEDEAWFVAKIKEKVPDAYIPAAALQELGGRMRRRRGSAAGSVRESLGKEEGV